MTKHKLAILFDREVLQTPYILSEIRDAAIISFGTQPPAEEFDRLFDRLSRFVEANAKPTAQPAREPGRGPPDGPRVGHPGAGPGRSGDDREIGQPAPGSPRRSRGRWPPSATP